MHWSLYDLLGREANKQIVDLFIQSRFPLALLIICMDCNNSYFFFFQWSIVIAGSILDIPILGGRKERSRPKPPQDLDNVSDRSVVYPFDAQSSPSKDKVKLVENGEHKSSST